MVDVLPARCLDDVGPMVDVAPSVEAPSSNVDVPIEGVSEPCLAHSALSLLDAAAAAPGSCWSLFSSLVDGDDDDDNGVGAAAELTE